MGCCSDCFTGCRNVCIFLGFIVGVAFIISGSVMYAQADERERRVGLFVPIYEEYRDYLKPLFASPQLVVHANGVPCVVREERVAFQGDVDGLPPEIVARYLVSERALSWKPLQRLNVTLTLVGGAGARNKTTTIMRSVPMHRRRQVPLKCTDAECSGDCRNARKQGSPPRRCNDGNMVRKCWKVSNLTGFFQKQVSGECIMGETCGTCHYDEYLDTACVPVRFDNAEERWVESYRASCRYPFTAFDHKYIASLEPPGVATVEVRDEHDPNLVLEHVTRGTRDFGRNAQALESSGLALIVTGSCLLVLSMAGCLYANRCCGYVGDNRTTLYDSNHQDGGNIVHKTVVTVQHDLNHHHQQQQQEQHGGVIPAEQTALDPYPPPAAIPEQYGRSHRRSRSRKHLDGGMGTKNVTIDLAPSEGIPSEGAVSPAIPVSASPDYPGRGPIKSVLKSGSDPRPTCHDGASSPMPPVPASRGGVQSPAGPILPHEVPVGEAEARSDRISQPSSFARAEAGSLVEPSSYNDMSVSAFAETPTSATAGTTMARSEKSQSVKPTRPLVPHRPPPNPRAASPAAPSGGGFKKPSFQPRRSAKKL